MTLGREWRHREGEKRGTETPRTTGGRETRERERERERERTRKRDKEGGTRGPRGSIGATALEQFGDEVRVWLSYAPGARA